MIKIRPARAGDLPVLMGIEFETFGPEMSASDEMLADRIELCGDGWFLVAENTSYGACAVAGDMILQPTRLTPEECTSWAAATDDGAMRGTFDPVGPNVYVVSLAVPAAAPPGTSDLLMHASLVRWARHCGFRSGSFFIFCSRMPGFAKTNRRTGIDPEDYWLLEREDGGPRDPMLHLYWEMSGGVWPVRLLRDGFPPDEESGGHGVLFALNDPEQALLASAEHIHRSGTRHGARTKEARHEEE